MKRESATDKDPQCRNTLRLPKRSGKPGTAPLCTEEQADTSYRTRFALVKRSDELSTQPRASLSVILHFLRFSWAAKFHRDLLLLLLLHVSAELSVHPLPDSYQLAVWEQKCAEDVKRRAETEKLK